MFGMFSLKTSIFKKLIKMKYSKHAQAGHRIGSTYILFICFLCCLCLLLLMNEEREYGLENQGSRMHREKVRVNKKRINKLLGVLERNQYSVWLNMTKNSEWKIYQREMDKYFEVSNDGRLLVNDEFMAMIKKMNDDYVNVDLDVGLRRENIVFLTAANADYFKPLKHSIKLKNLFFPKNKMLVYDLGMNSAMVDELIEICHCEVKPFGTNAYPDHFKNAQTYSWKPIIVQEALNKIENNEFIIYMDSSIKIKSSEIDDLIRKSNVYGVAIGHLDLKLPCYTDPRMFEWFGEQAQQYTNINTFEANFILLKKNFLTSFILSIWTSCALDQNCIAPKGSHIFGSLRNWIQGCHVCGCHRFDQDALTIIYTFFFNFLPKFTLSPKDKTFYDIKRKFFENI